MSRQIFVLHKDDVNAITTVLEAAAQDHIFEAGEAATTQEARIHDAYARGYRTIIADIRKQADAQ